MELLVVVVICGLFGLMYLAMVMYFTKQTELEIGARYPEELRAATREFIEVLQASNSISDPTINDFIDKNEHRHPLFRNVAIGLTRLYYDSRVD